MRIAYKSRTLIVTTVYQLENVLDVPLRHGQVTMGPGTCVRSACAGSEDLSMLLTPVLRRGPHAYPP